MKESQVDIIVPIYGALRFLKRCVGAVLGNTLIPYILWLVDDCSPLESGVTDLLRKLYDPRIRNIFNEENLGFGGACNRGAAAGSAPFICLLNSDTEVQEGWLSAMLANMGDPKVGMVGAKLIYPPLPRQTSHTHLAGRIQNAGIYFDNKGFPREAFQNYPAHHLLVNRRIEVSAVTHACVLIRRSEWHNGYDPQYEIGAFEDVDMCLDFKERDLKIIYEPDALVWHAQGASYQHSESSANLRRLMAKWKDKMEPDPNIFRLADRKILPKPERWWEKND